MSLPRNIPAAWSQPACITHFRASFLCILKENLNEGLNLGNKARVALVYFRENYTPAPPMGILYIGTILARAGFDVKVIDSFPGFNEGNIKRICDFKPDLIGISVLTTGHRIAANYTRVLKEALPRARVCWGGVHASAIPTQILQTEPVDFVVIGEGEETMLEVCSRLSEDNNVNLEGIKGVVYKSKNGIIANERRDLIQNLDSLPIPNRRLLESPSYGWYISPPGIIRGKFFKGITTFYTSRGCPYNCIFCCSHETMGRKVRQRSVANVLEEIRYLRKEFNVKGLYFNDDIFGVDKKWVKDFCEKLQREEYDLVWGCQTRANLVDRALLKEMKAAGCVQVDIGCESGSRKVLKNLKKEIEVEDIIQAFECAQDVGIETFSTFIIGNPGEQMEDIYETEKLARRINSRVSFLILVPYPGSELFEMAKKNNWLLDKELHFAENWMTRQSENPVMEINIKSGELLRIRARLQNEYFWKNNLKIFASFIAHPAYLFKIIFACSRHSGEISKTLLVSIRQKKTSIFLEAVYQKFNEELMKSYA